MAVHAFSISQVAIASALAVLTVAGACCLTCCCCCCSENLVYLAPCAALCCFCCADDGGRGDGCCSPMVCAELLCLGGWTVSWFVLLLHTWGQGCCCLPDLFPLLFADHHTHFAKTRPHVTQVGCCARYGSRQAKAHTTATILHTLMSMVTILPCLLRLLGKVRFILWVSSLCVIIHFLFAVHSEDA